MDIARRFPERAANGAAALLTALLLPFPAAACPDCAEGIRAQVRAGIFDGASAHNLFIAALPFAFFAGITAVIHFGLPRGRRHHG